MTIPAELAALPKLNVSVNETGSFGASIMHRLRAVEARLALAERLLERCAEDYRDDLARHDARAYLQFRGKESAP